MEPSDRIVIGASAGTGGRGPVRRRRSWPAGLAMSAVVAAAILLSTPLGSEPEEAAVPQLDAPDDPAGMIESPGGSPEAAPADVAGWYPVLSSTIDSVWDVQADLVGAVVVDGRQFLVTTGGVLEVVETGGRLGVVRSEEVPGAGSPTSSVSAFDFGGPPLQVYSGIGGWTGGSEPLLDVRAVGRVAVTDFQEASASEFLVVAADETGRWVVYTELPDTIYVTHPVAGGLVGQKLSNGDAVDDAVFSSDGREWTPMPGWTLAGTLGALPLLQASDGSAVVGSTDDLPEVDPIRLPNRAEAGGVLAAGDGIIAVDDVSIHIRAGDGNWRTLPVDADHGVSEPAVALSADPPRIATIVGDRVTIFSWTD